MATLPRMPKSALRRLASFKRRSLPGWRWHTWQCCQQCQPQRLAAKFRSAEACQRVRRASTAPRSSLANDRSTDTSVSVSVADGPASPSSCGGSGSTLRAVVSAASSIPLMAFSKAVSLSRTTSSAVSSTPRAPIASGARVGVHFRAAGCGSHPTAGIANPEQKTFAHDAGAEAHASRPGKGSWASEMIGDRSVATDCEALPAVPRSRAKQTKTVHRTRRTAIRPRCAVGACPASQIGVLSRIGSRRSGAR